MLSAVLLYNFILLGSTFFVYLSEKCIHKSDRNFFLFVAFLMIFLVSALRYDVGTDFLAYINIYNNIADYDNMEVGFYYINLALYNLELSSQWSIIAFSFIFTVIIFYSYPSEKKYIIHLIIFSTLLLYSFNGIRQAIAIACGLLALKYYLSNYFIKSLIIVFFGVLFHKSIIILLPVFMISKIPFSNLYKFYIIPFVMIALLVVSQIFILQLVFGIGVLLDVLNLPYANYFNHERHFVPTSLGSGLGVLAKLVFSIYVLSNSQFFLKKNSKYWLLIISIFLYAVSVILAKEIEIFGRLEQIFLFAPIICAYLLIVNSIKLNTHKIVSGIYILFLLISFSKIVISGANDYTDPKLYPYQTIFNYEQS